MNNNKFKELYKYFLDKKIMSFITSTNEQVKNLVNYRFDEQHTIENYNNINLEYCTQQHLVDMYKNIISSEQEYRSFCMEWEPTPKRDIEKMYFMLIELSSLATPKSLLDMFISTIEQGDKFMFEHILKYPQYSEAIVLWKDNMEYSSGVRILCLSLINNETLTTHLLRKEFYSNFLNNPVYSAFLLKSLCTSNELLKKREIIENNFKLLIDSNCDSSLFQQQIDNEEIKFGNAFCYANSNNKLLQLLAKHSFKIKMEKKLSNKSHQYRYKI